MNFSDRWILHVAKSAGKALTRADRPERERLQAALLQMEQDPCSATRELGRLHNYLV